MSEEKNKSSEDKKEVQEQAKPNVTFLDILKDPEAVAAIEKLMVQFFDRYKSNAGGHRIFLGICFVVLVAAVVTLSIQEKMDPSAGVILGALAGYLFGRKDD